MKIRSIETIPVALPRRREHTWSGNSAPIGAYLILRVLTDEGLIGLGEASTLIDWGGGRGRNYGESQKTAAHVIADYLAPAITGQDPCRIALIHELMDRAVKGHPYAKAAIDVACYDLIGKAADLPVHAFLGGAYRTEIAVAHSFGLTMTADAIEHEASLVLAEGIRSLKVKVGSDLDRDVEAVRRLRRLEATVAITVDANGAWPDVPTAAEAIRRLDAHVLAAVEQPVEDRRGLAEVRVRVRPPIMADESAWTPADVHELAETRAADYISIYYSKAGGLYGGAAVAAACAAVGMRANVNGSAETGIGNAANLHLASCAAVIDLPSLIMASAPAGTESTRYACRLYDDDLITRPYGYKNGHITVPDGPGLGVMLDEEKVTKYRIDR
jgi:muconate cycloisomerase